MVHEGLAYHEAGQLNAAMQCYERALGVNPNDVNGLQLYGTLALQLGEYERAVQLLHRAIKVLPIRASFHVNLGSALRSLGRRAEAVKAYESITLEPDMFKAWMNIGLCLQEWGNTSD